MLLSKREKKVYISTSVTVNYAKDAHAHTYTHTHTHTTHTLYRLIGVKDSVV